MTMVEASWQNEAGMLLTIPARMELKSANGACIRVKTPISVGSKLSIQWRFDKFTGIARNIRTEGRDYLVGIQRDGTNTAVSTPISVPAAAQLATPPLPTFANPVASPIDPPKSAHPPLSPAAAAAAWTAKRRSLRNPDESKSQSGRAQESNAQETNAQAIRPAKPESRPREIPPAVLSQETKVTETASIPQSEPIKPVEISLPPQHPEARQVVSPPITRNAPTIPFMRIAGRATPVLPRRIEHDARIRDGPLATQAPDPEPARSTEAHANQPPQAQGRRKDPGTERKRMRPKWLGLASWQNKEDAPNESRNGNSDTNSADESEKENRMAHATAPMNAKKLGTDPAGEESTFQVDLLPMDDIYRAAGIMSPPKGYGIKKVVDMLNSEYVRALSKDMKRAAVLMALDAAGVPIQQLQQDARARQDALDSYEAAQRKQVEGEWARKTEENVQIQAELERVKAHHQARIARNLDAIAREKATFSTWLALKQQETHSMLEAAELCLKAPAAEPATKSEANANPASDPAKDLLSDASLAKAAAAGSKPM
jgi:hypothetical protein